VEKDAAFLTFPGAGSPYQAHSITAAARAFFGIRRHCNAAFTAKKFIAHRALLSVPQFRSFGSSFNLRAQSKPSAPCYPIAHGN
jgi:hypothetical protein